MGIQGTRLESDEEVRKALLMYRPTARYVSSPQEPIAPPDDGPPLFRPTQRPATPILTILDDGSEEGETIRIRKDQFIIGRSEGDIVLPNDSQMSSRHAELRRTVGGDQKQRWQLIDLKSTNGTYVRIGHAVLSHGQEFILGRSRFCFENASTELQSPANTGSTADQSTRLWQSGLPQGTSPAVRELTPDGAGDRATLANKEVWLGKDSNYCAVVLRDDPFVSARHARIRQDEEGRWLIENNKSINGVWLRVDRIPLKGVCRFLLGEQQFKIHIPV